jgi:hypothetical protein
MIRYVVWGLFYYFIDNFMIITYFNFINVIVYEDIIGIIHIFRGFLSCGAFIIIFRLTIAFIFGRPLFAGISELAYLSRLRTLRIIRFVPILPSFSYCIQFLLK